MSTPGALQGIKVLDMTRVVAGPYAGQILGDLGAEVIKIERSGEGDDVRRVGPPWMRDSNGYPTGESTYFQSVNRNKKSFTVDFSQPEGAALVAELAARADILIENYRTGTLARYGLGYKDLQAKNSRLIYCSLTGFGQTGPYAERSGYDYLVQAMAGLMSVTGERDGLPGAGPTRVGVPIADICAGLYTAIAALAALQHRNQTGRGQLIDVSLFDSQVAAMLNTFSAWFNSGTELGRTGNDHPSAAPYGVFEVDDGFILIATFNDREFVRLADALGHPEWAKDPRFVGMGDRVANREPLRVLVTESLRGKTKAEWVEHLNSCKVSAGSINSMEDLEKDPQFIDRGLKIEQSHPLGGKVYTSASPMRFSDSPVEYRLPPPLMGEHSESVLRDWLGLTDAEISRLIEKGII